MLVAKGPGDPRSPPESASEVLDGSGRSPPKFLTGLFFNNFLTVKKSAWKIADATKGTFFNS